MKLRYMVGFSMVVTGAAAFQVISDLKSEPTRSTASAHAEKSVQEAVKSVAFEVEKNSLLVSRMANLPGAQNRFQAKAIQKTVIDSHSVQVLGFSISKDKQIEWQNEQVSQLLKETAKKDPREISENLNEAFSQLSHEQISERYQLLEVANKLAQTENHPEFREVIFSQAESFMHSTDNDESNYGTAALQNFLALEKDPVERQRKAEKISTFLKVEDKTVEQLNEDQARLKLDEENRKTNEVQPVDTSNQAQ